MRITTPCITWLVELGKNEGRLRVKGSLAAVDRLIDGLVSWVGRGLLDWNWEYWVGLDGMECVALLGLMDWS